MNKLLVAMLFALLPSSLSAQDGSLGSLRESVNRGTVGLLAARSDSSFTRLADNMGLELDAENLRILTVLGRGSFENVSDLLFLKGIDVAFAQSDILSFYERVDAFPNIKNHVRFITRIGDEELHLMARTAIKSIDELAGKKVNFGREKTGSFLTASIVFDELGISVDATTFPHKKAYQLLANGEIDAMVKVDGKPVGVVSDASLDDGVHLIPVPADRLTGVYDGTTISYEDYPRLFASGDQIETVSVSSVLAVYNWPNGHPRKAKVDRFINSLFENINALKDPDNGYDPKWLDVDLTADVPGWDRAPLASALLSTQ